MFVHYSNLEFPNMPWFRLVGALDTHAIYADGAVSVRRPLVY